MSEELLELLWVLEATLAMERDLEQTLHGVVAGRCFRASELPEPTPEERRAPGIISTGGALLEMVDVENDDGV